MMENALRLDAQEKHALKKALEGVDGKIFVFGSRTDNTKHGGDIDVLIFSKTDPYRTSQDVAVKFFQECEEKIDVVVMDPDHLTKEQKAFLRVIHKNLSYVMDDQKLITQKTHRQMMAAIQL